MCGLIIRGSLVAIATAVCLVTASLHAQQASQLKVTILVAETPVTGVPDKVFVLLTAESPPASAPVGTHIRATNTAPVRKAL